jgi:hypothetical protein
MLVGMDDRFPPYTSRESRARPAGVGRPFCTFSALSDGLAALIDLSIIASPAFAADFDGGSGTADVAGGPRNGTSLFEYRSDSPHRASGDPPYPAVSSQ